MTTRAKQWDWEQFIRDGTRPYRPTCFPLWMEIDVKRIEARFYLVRAHVSGADYWWDGWSFASFGARRYWSRKKAEAEVDRLRELARAWEALR